jgi:hypothetical protein
VFKRVLELNYAVDLEAGKPEIEYQTKLKSDRVLMKESRDRDQSH